MVKEDVLVTMASHGSATKNPLMNILTSVELLSVLVTPIVMELRLPKEYAIATIIMFGVQITRLAS